MYNVRATLSGSRARFALAAFPLVLSGLAILSAPVPAAAISCTPTGNQCPSDQTCVLEGSAEGSVYTCVPNGTGGSINTGGTNAGGGSGGGFPNPLSVGTSLSGLLTDVLNLVMRIGTVVIILMLVFVGFKYVTARGNPGAIGQAHEALKWTVIGALILLGSAALAQGICATVVALGSGSGSCPSLL